MIKTIIVIGFLTQFILPAYADRALMSNEKQTIWTFRNGPSFLASIDDKYYLIGQKGGVLSWSDVIQIVVVSKISKWDKYGESTFYKTSYFVVQKDWSNLGHLSYPISRKDLFNLTNKEEKNFKDIKIHSVSFAFYANGVWDSNYGNNYQIELSIVSPHLSGYTYSQSSSTECKEHIVCNDVWPFIISEFSKL